MTPNSCEPSETPTANSIDFMERLDRMPGPWRELVYDFGWVIVSEMIADGHRNAAQLREELETWRERQQAKWLAEIPYPRSR